MILQRVESAFDSKINIKCCRIYNVLVFLQEAKVCSDYNAKRKERILTP